MEKSKSEGEHHKATANAGQALTAASSFLRHHLSSTADNARFAEDMLSDKTAKETRRDEVLEKTSDDVKVRFDIIEAIHCTEKKQSDTDAYMYSAEKRKMKMKLITVMAILLLMLANPVHADKFAIFGKVPYNLQRYDATTSYQSFHEGSFRMALVEDGIKVGDFTMIRATTETKYPPDEWIVLEITAAGTDDEVTYAIRNDNIFIIGFANKDGIWYCFGAIIAVLGCDNDKVLPFTGSYGEGGLMSSAVIPGEKELKKSRNQADMGALELGQQAALDALMVLSRYDPTTSDEEVVKRALKTHILMICEAQRFKRVGDAIKQAWPGPVQLHEVGYLWYWSMISCIVVYDHETGRFPPVNFGTRDRSGSGIDRPAQAAALVDLLQFPWDCLRANGLLDKYRALARQASPSPAPAPA